jgi:hypothetical protein
MASRRGDGGGGQSLRHHPNAPFQLRRDSILALQTLQRRLQVPSLHHGEVRVVAGQRERGWGYLDSEWRPQV